MIVSVYDYEGDGNHTFTSNGCGCCSVNYHYEIGVENGDKETIINEIKENIKVAKEACVALGIDFNSLL